ncbi:MAG: PAS domain-containing protein [Firmicutes bacterium]|nr:PAS domain-containing protein [Bacillota bacterium]
MFDDQAAILLLKQVVSALGRVLGDKCEVVLHDLRSPESSIVEIVHGEITGRQVGDPSTNLGLPIFNNPYGDYDQYNYRAKTRSGRTLKSSSIYLKDPSGRIFAAICINYDITDLMVATNILRDFVATEDQIDEHFATDINELITQILDETIESQRTALALGDKEERLKLIRMLYDRGVFSVKGTVDRVANLLGVSRVTVYGYLSEVQAMKKDNIVT